MVVASNITTPIFLLESVYAFIVVLCSILIFVHIRRLYAISNHHGLRYFSNAFLFFGIAMLLRYIIMIMSFFYFEGAFAIGSFLPLGLMIFMSVSIGGFFLSYSLVWKSLERYIPQHVTMVSIYIVSTFVAVLEILAKTNDKSLYLLFSIQLISLLFALLFNYSHAEHAKKMINPFSCSVVLGFTMFLLMFVGELLSTVYESAHIYVVGIFCLLYVSVLFHVLRVAKQ